MKNKKTKLLSTMFTLSVFSLSFLLFSCSPKKVENDDTSSNIISSTEPISTEEPSIITPDEPTKNIYTITFVLNQDDFFTQEVKENDLINVPEPPSSKEDDTYIYEFTGWYTSPELIDIFDFQNTKINSSFSLYAGWKKNEKNSFVETREISYDFNTFEEPVLHQIENDNLEKQYTLYFIIGNNQSNFDINFSYNIETDIISFEKFKLIGYTFNGWYLDANMINEPFDNANTTLASLNKDTIYLYAKFTEDTPTPSIEEQCEHQIETRILQQGSCKTGAKRIEQTYCVKCGETYGTTEYTVYHEMPDKSECEHFAPTCTEKGYYVQKCKNCDYQLQYIYADEIDHNLVNRVVVEPTCTANGYSADVCTMCGTEFNRVTIEPTGHNYYAVGTIPSTCSTNGYELFQCRCGNTLEGDRLPLDENNHVYDANGVCYLCGHQKEE